MKDAPAPAELPGGSVSSPNRAGGEPGWTHPCSSPPQNPTVLQTDVYHRQIWRLRSWSPVSREAPTRQSQIYKHMNTVEMLQFSSQLAARTLTPAWFIFHINTLTKWRSIRVLFSHWLLGVVIIPTAHEGSMNVSSRTPPSGRQRYWLSHLRAFVFYKSRSIIFCSINM